MDESVRVDEMLRKVGIDTIELSGVTPCHNRSRSMEKMVRTMPVMRHLLRFSL